MAPDVHRWHAGSACAADEPRHQLSQPPHPSAASAPPEPAVSFDLWTFARSAGVLSIGSLAGLARAVITAKLFAVTLGPTTVGILAQLLNFSAFVATIIPLGLTTGVVQMVARNRAGEEAVRRVVGTAVALSLAAGLAALVVLAPASGQISSTLTGSPGYAVLVLLIVASFPLYNLAGVLGYVLQGLADVNRLTAASVATAIASVLILVPAAYRFGLAGAIATVLVMSLVQSAIYAVAVWRSYGSRQWRLLPMRFDRSVGWTLLGFGTIVLMGGVANWGSLLAVRTLAVRELGGYENGLYQVVYGLSNQYITIFMTWMAAYVFPRIASESRTQHLSALLNSGLRANLFLMVPVLALTIALRDPLIRLLYSPSFLPAENMVPVQALGDYARVIGWSFGVALFALGRVRAHLMVVVSQSVAWILLSVALLPLLGLPAVPTAYAISFLLYPALSYPMVRGWFGVRLDAGNAAMLVIGLGGLLAAVALPPPAGVVGALAVPVTEYGRRIRNRRRDSSAV